MPKKKKLVKASEILNKSAHIASNKLSCFERNFISH